MSMPYVFNTATASRARSTDGNFATTDGGRRTGLRFVDSCIAVVYPSNWSRRVATVWRPFDDKVQGAISGDERRVTRGRCPRRIFHSRSRAGIRATPDTAANSQPGPMARSSASRVASSCRHKEPTPGNSVGSRAPPIPTTCSRWLRSCARTAERRARSSSTTGPRQQRRTPASSSNSSNRLRRLRNADRGNAALSAPARTRRSCPRRVGARPTVHRALRRWAGPARSSPPPPRRSAALRHPGR